jgi:hypothetical protein
MSEENYVHQAVRQFQETFDTPRDLDFWAELVREEAQEAAEALVHLYKELADWNYVVAGYLNVARDLEIPPGGEPHIELIQATANLINLVQAHMEGKTSVMPPVFEAVHKSNMSKVGDDGEPERHPETGKIMKGPNYRPAEPAVAHILFPENANAPQDGAAIDVGSTQEDQ